MSGRYSIITPRTTRTTSVRPDPIVSDPVLRARDELGRVMKTGTVADIGVAYAKLEMADKLAKTRRDTAHALRRVHATLGGFPCPPANRPSDPSWERMVNAVASWRR